MIKQETITINGRTLIKTFSDSGKYIIQNETGVKHMSRQHLVLNSNM